MGRLVLAGLLGAGVWLSPAGWRQAVAAPPIEPAACLPATITAAAEQVTRARQEVLRKGGTGEPHTEVPVPLQRALAEEKRTLTVLVTAWMGCAPADLDPASVAPELARLVPEAAVPASDTGYGGGIGFAARLAPAALGLIGITAEIQIACGSDTLLWVFAPQPAGGWQPVLRWQSPDYSTVAGAFGSFDYAIAPPDVEGRWYLVAKSVAPWCSSTWSTLHWTVLRPSASVAAPRQLLTQAPAIWWGGEDFGSLEAHAGDFIVRYTGANLDSGLHSRRFIQHYAVAGDRLRRIPPVAASPRDFVDEWIVAPWTEAGVWTAPAVRTRLQAVHARLHRDHDLEFVSARACPVPAGAPPRFQLELGELNGPRHRYFLVSGATEFRLTGIADRADPACSGPDLLGQMVTR